MARVARQKKRGKTGKPLRPPAAVVLLQPLRVAAAGRTLRVCQPVRLPRPGNQPFIGAMSDRSGGTELGQYHLSCAAGVMA